MDEDHPMREHSIEVHFVDGDYIAFYPAVGLSRCSAVGDSPEEAVRLLCQRSPEIERMTEKFPPALICREQWVSKIAVWPAEDLPGVWLGEHQPSGIMSQGRKGKGELDAFKHTLEALRLMRQWRAKQACGKLGS